MYSDQLALWSKCEDWRGRRVEEWSNSTSRMAGSCRGQLIGGKGAKADAGCSLVLIDRHAHWQRLTLAFDDCRWVGCMQGCWLLVTGDWFLGRGTKYKRKRKDCPKMRQSGIVQFPII